MATTVDKSRYDRGSVKMKLTGELSATLLNDLERYSSGLMVMKLADTDLRVFDGDQELGSMGVALGGTLYVSIKDGENVREWSIDPLAIFQMVLDAEKQQYAK